MGNNDETRFSLEGIPKFTKSGIKKSNKTERWKFPEGLT